MPACLIVFLPEQSLAHRREKQGTPRDPPHRARAPPAASMEHECGNRAGSAANNSGELLINFRIGRSSIQPFRHNAQLLAGKFISAPFRDTINPSCDSRVPSFRIRRVAIPAGQSASANAPAHPRPQPHPGSVPQERRRACRTPRAQSPPATRQPVAEGVHVIVSTSSQRCLTYMYCREFKRLPFAAAQPAAAFSGRTGRSRTCAGATRRRRERCVEIRHIN